MPLWFACGGITAGRTDLLHNELITAMAVPRNTTSGNLHYPPISSPSSPHPITPYPHIPLGPIFHVLFPRAPSSVAGAHDDCTIDQLCPNVHERLKHLP